MPIVDSVRRKVKKNWVHSCHIYLGILIHLVCKITGNYKKNNWKKSLSSDCQQFLISKNNHLSPQTIEHKNNYWTQKKPQYKWHWKSWTGLSQTLIKFKSELNLLLLIKFMYISSKLKCQLSFNTHLILIEDCATQSWSYIVFRNRNKNVMS